MKKVMEYRQHAQECRALAKSAQTDSERAHLLTIAGIWHGLAVERDRIVQVETGTKPTKAG